MEGEKQKSNFDVIDSLSKETCETTEVVEDFDNVTYLRRARQHSSESTSGDSSSESSRPLSPGAVTTQHYYFYQGI